MLVSVLAGVACCGPVAPIDPTRDWDFFLSKGFYYSPHPTDEVGEGPVFDSDPLVVVPDLPI